LPESLALLNPAARRTGVGKYTTSLLKHIPDRQWEVSLFNFNVFGSRAFSEYPPAKKQRMIHGPLPNRTDLLSLPVKYVLYHMGFLRKSLEHAGKFALYHATTGDLAHLAGVSERFVVTWHDVGYFRHPYSPYLRFINWNLSFADKVSHVIVSSEHTRVRLAQKVKRPPKRLSVVPFGVGDEFWPESRAEARRRIGLPVGGRIILSVGRDWYPRNIGTVIEAASHLRDVKLLRVGRLFASAKAWGQAKSRENLILRENVEDEDLVHYYNASDALVFPSISEGLEPLEAMKCGIPVIATRLGAFPEMLGSDALFVRDPKNPVEVAEVVLYLLENRGLGEELRANGIVRAAKFSWAESVRKTIEVYNQVLNA